MSRKGRRQWELICLEADGPSGMVGDHFERRFFQKPRRVPVEARHEVSMGDLAGLIEEALGAEVVGSGRPTMTVYGHGSLHHYTYGLCKVLADRRSEEYGYIHFDQHDDMDEEIEFPEDRDMLYCGNFLSWLQRRCKAANVLIIGADNRRYLQVLPKTLRTDPLRRLMDCLSRLPRDVYLSFDLDVMHKDEITTGWPWDGGLRKEEVLQCIRTIRLEKNIIGADILGLDDTGLRPGMRERSLSLYTTIAAELMGW